MKPKKQLISLTSFGTSPALLKVYEQQGYQVSPTKTLRKALSLIKQLSPDVVVAEFIYAPTYGSQLSNFESLFAAAQAYAPEARFIALVHKDDLAHLEKVVSESNPCEILVYPVTGESMNSCLANIANQQ